MSSLYSDLIQQPDVTPERRKFLKQLATGAAVASVATFMPTLAMAGKVPGSGHMDFDSAQEWLSGFYKYGAKEIVSWYADKFVWEDLPLFGTITNKEELYKAFLPFNNAGPDSPIGVQKFQVVMYDGGDAGRSRGVPRKSSAPPDGWTKEKYDPYRDDIMKHYGLDYDEWGYMQWVWKSENNADILGLPSAGKTTYCRGCTFQCYKDRQIVRDQTHWNFRDFAVQLGVVGGYHGKFAK